MKIFVERELDTVHLLVHARVPLLSSDDLAWLIDQLLKSDFQSQAIWAKLSWWALDRTNYEQVDLVYTASTENETLKEQFASLFAPRVLDDPKTIEIRTQYLAHKRTSQAIEERRKTATPPFGSINKALDAIEQGELVQWIYLSLTLLLFDAAEGRYVEYRWNPNLESFPAWKDLTTEQKLRIYQAAHRFVIDGEASKEVWIDRDVYVYQDLAGYIALFNKYKQDLRYVHSLENTILAKWVQVVVWHPIQSGEEKETEELQSALIKETYEKAPSLVIKNIMLLLNKNEFYLLYKFYSVWNPDIVRLCMIKLQEAELTNDEFFALLNHLLRHQERRAIDYALDTIRSTFSTEEQKAHIVLAGAALITNAIADGWGDLWRLILNDTDLGREIVEKTAPIVSWDRDQLSLKLKDEELADLYVWLEQQYSHSEDPWIEEIHSVSVREQIATWRNTLLRHLQNRGTPKSASEIQRIASLFSNYDWLQALKEEVNTALDEVAWEPLPPQFVLSLAIPKPALIDRARQSQILKFVFILVFSILCPFVYTVFQPEIRAFFGVISAPTSTETTPASESDPVNFIPSSETIPETNTLQPSEPHQESTTEPSDKMELDALVNEVNEVEVTGTPEVTPEATGTPYPLTDVYRYLR